MSKCYYHYTSVDVLYNIVKNKELWFSNLCDTNDPQELKYCDEEFKNSLSKIIKNNISELVQDIKDSEFKELLKNTLPIINLEDLPIQDNLDIKPYFVDYYNLSMTENRDSQLHWLQYGNNFKGVCIGFNADEIQFFPGFNFIDKIIYTDEYKNAEIDKRIIKEIKNYLEHIFCYNFYLQNTEELKTHCMLTMINSVHALIKPFIKKKYFNNENEIRFYSRILHKKIENKEEYTIIDDDISKPEQILVNGKIKDIIKINIEEPLKHGLIKEIILGFHCNQNEYVLRKFLNNNGVNKNYKISKSEFAINL